MKITLGQAAKQTGISKPTISKACGRGDLSYDKNDDGSYAIDPAELDRWVEGYRNRNGKSFQADTPVNSPVSEGVSSINDKALQVEIDSLRERLAEMKGERDRWHDQAEHWRKTSENTQRLLTHIEEEKAARPRGGIFGFLKRSA